MSGNVTTSNTSPSVVPVTSTSALILDDVNKVLSKIKFFFSGNVYAEVDSLWVRIRNVFTNELTNAKLEAHFLLSEVEVAIANIKSKL